MQDAEVRASLLGIGIGYNSLQFLLYLKGAKSLYSQAVIFTQMAGHFCDEGANHLLDIFGAFAQACAHASN